MRHKHEIKGRIVRGKGEAAFFAALDWVREQCMEKLGFTPYPGTLNLEVMGETGFLETLRKSGKGVTLIPPDPQFCEARTWPLSIKMIPAALVIPADEVRIHGDNVIEILSPVRIKDALGVDDGDTITLEFDGE